MEFQFDVRKVLPGLLTVLESDIDGSDIKIYPLDVTDTEKQDSTSSWIYHSSANSPWDIKLKKKKEDLVTILDEMGSASAQAQGLRSPITTLKKLLSSQKQKVYIMRDSENTKSVIGFLKVGVKRLFVCDDVGAHHEVDPLCILDFYVHESKQRCGFGHKLFSIMLQAEKVTPEKVAVDRPSLKFLAFFKKHYKLEDPIVQANNFVIYPGFFLDREDSRPPIFLYSGKAMQPERSNNMKKQYPLSSFANETEALNSIKVSLSSDELKKNKAYYSSAAKCLMWNDEEKARNKQHHTPNSSARSLSTNSSNVKSSGNWHVHSALQSCSSANKNQTDGWNSNHSTPCSLTPVDNIPNYSRKKWDQLQTSWNILGVKPVDYTFYEK